MAARKKAESHVRKPIQEIIGELQSWLPNYDHGPNDYPTLLFRILASAPGGDRLEDVGYEPFKIGWHEIDQLGRVLEAIQDARDVEDIVDELLRDEEEEVEEELSERRRRARGPVDPPLEAPRRGPVGPPLQAPRHRREGPAARSAHAPLHARRHRMGPSRRRR